MNKLTEEQINQNDDLSTSEVKQDIKDTREEIDNYRDEKNILMKNPPENKVRIYFLGGKISRRQIFIDKLQQILDCREKQND